MCVESDHLFIEFYALNIYVCAKLEPINVLHIDVCI